MKKIFNRYALDSNKSRKNSISTFTVETSISLCAYPRMWGHPLHETYSTPS